MKHLFAYGTLMCDDIMAEISGVRLSRISALLRGYRRLCVKGEHFPALVEDVKGSVEGIVYLNIPEPTWVQLDRFEGEMYWREGVQVECSRGHEVQAETYVVRPEFRDCLTGIDWDFETFICKYKDIFRQSYNQ